MKKMLLIFLFVMLFGSPGRTAAGVAGTAGILASQVAVQTLLGH